MYIYIYICICIYIYIYIYAQNVCRPCLRERPYEYGCMTHTHPSASLVRNTHLSMSSPPPCLDHCYCPRVASRFPPQTSVISTHVCVYVCVYIYIYIYTYVYVYISTNNINNNMNVEISIRNVKLRRHARERRT